MEIKQNKRELVIPTKAINVETRTIDVAFCSEQPVEREINGEIYQEILLCGPENADLRRLNNNGAVLYNHNRDELIGAVVSARMDSDRVGRATLRISNTATEEWEMIQEGILVHISIGYNINDYRFDGNKIYVTDYEIYEVSLVTVPADPTAGIGRSLGNTDLSESLNKDSDNKTEDQPIMEDEKKVESVEVEEAHESVLETIEHTVEEVAETIEEVVEHVEEKVEEVVEAVVEELKRDLTDTELLDLIQGRPELLNKLTANESVGDALEAERQRELTSIGAVLNIDVSEAIAKGISVTEFKRQLNDKKNPSHDKEIKQMEKNLIKDMVRSIKTGDKSALDNYERGQHGFVRAVVPATNTTTAAGAVNEDLQDQYIPQLLKLSVLNELAPQVYSGLAGRGVLSIPTASGVSPVFKKYAEGEEVTDSISSFGKLVLTPTIFAGGIPLTRSAILTAPNIESFVQAELLRYAAQGLEEWVFDEIAAAAPVLETAASGELTQADVQNAIAKLGASNVDVRRCKAVMNSKMLAKMRQTKVLDNSAAVAMVEGHRAEAMWLNDEVQVVVSEFVADDVILIGKFDEVIIANWENSEVDFDDTTYRSSNTVVYRVWDYSDVALAHDEAFVQLTIKA